MYSYFWKKYNFIFNIIFFFQENLIFLGFTSKFRYDWDTLNTDIFFIWPYEKYTQHVTLVLLGPELQCLLKVKEDLS